MALSPQLKPVFPAANTENSPSTVNPNDYLVDGRWKGDHGIARYATEILSRLPDIPKIKDGPPPIHPLDGLWVSWTLGKRRKKPKAYFSPGFNAPVITGINYAFTMHDLTHLASGTLRRLFYEAVLKPAAKRATRLVTVSNFSKTALLNWAALPPEKVTVISNGYSDHFKPQGTRYSPAYPYLLFIGNQKPHKNITRLLQAYSQTRACRDLKLLMSGNATAETSQQINTLGLTQKVIFTGSILEADLPSYYRGASALIYPSLHEGFGLPLVESMACGTPAVISNVEALPEVADGAALLVDPYQVDDIAEGIDRVCFDHSLHDRMRVAGLRSAARYSWSESASKLKRLLFELAYET